MISSFDRHFCLNGGSNFAAAKVLQINCSKGTVNNDYAMHATRLFFVSRRVKSRDLICMV